MSNSPGRPIAVRLCGGGAAAFAAARALADHGMRLQIEAGPMPPAKPHLLLNEPTVRLLDDLFGGDADLRRHAHVIRGRLVRWGRGGADLVEEPGLALAGTTLHRVLAARLCDDGSAPASDDISWTILARGRGGNDNEVIVMGDRVAIAAPATLSAKADPSLCAVEAVAGGWLFLLPLGRDRAVVQAIVPQRPHNPVQALDTLLAQSRLVARLIAARTDAPEMFSCAPRLRPEPARPGWIAAGDAALAFDPLCGDGTGQALRCGLLAGAIIAAIAQGEPQGACLAHYRDRLRRAMRAHLRAVVAFYNMAPCRDVWACEIARAQQALDDIAGGDVSSAMAARYRLERFSLVRAAA